MKAVKAELTIKNIESYGHKLYRVECESEEILPHMAAGQFAHIKVPNRDLRRPICIYDSEEHGVSFIIAEVGAGTAAFTAQKKGARFDALLPLGNGFPVLPDRTNIALLGGGTGCAPLLKIAKDNPSLNCTALLGFPDASARAVYKDDFDKYCKKVCYCTDDGSLGYHGYPTELLTEIAPEVIYVCGAPGLMRTAQKFCKDRGVIGFASTEQRMGCGVGACLVCSVKIVRDGKERLLRACADGPVFPIEEIVL
ncbi:MAG: dihydroorotate dehydrogenase electron transfer subunit [Clostridiales bacterium]|nr:dihydroorotate dehydrogenase electron transfer subunit [Clostridiales bacterium]